MTTTVTFNYTGAEQSFTVPAGVFSLDVDLYGAGGGNGTDGAGIQSRGGFGGRVRGKLAVTPGEVLKIYVGQWGADGTFNGGGARGSSSTARWGGNGGGATDIRQGGNALGNRVAVAGGGGGGGGDPTSPSFTWGKGGDGGGTSGQNGAPSETGGGVPYGAGAVAGTPGAGGTDGANPGSIGAQGQGGNGGNGTGAGGGSGGGGGGGYYGGGGGSGWSTSSASGAGGGGGGSGYAGGLTAATLTAGGGATANGQVIIKYDVFPNAPILTAPANGAIIDLNATNRFEFPFSHVDPLMTQKSYDLRYRIVGTTTWTTLSATTANSYRDIPGGTFSAGNYEWQVRQTASDNGVGPYSASSFFTAAVKPATPAITLPTLDDEVGPNILATWTSVAHTMYQVRRVADLAGSPDTSTVYEDTGDQDGADNEYLLYATVDDRVEHIQVRVFNGLWSDWATRRVHVLFVSPPAPDVTLTVNNELGYIDVDIVNPPTGDPDSEAHHNEIWISSKYEAPHRVTAGVPPDGSFRYWFPASGVEYLIDVRAYGVNGASTSSED